MVSVPDVRTELSSAGFMPTTVWPLPGELGKIAHPDLLGSICIWYGRHDSRLHLYDREELAPGLFFYSLVQADAGVVVPRMFRFDAEALENRARTERALSELVGQDAATAIFRLIDSSMDLLKFDPEEYFRPDGISERVQRALTARRGLEYGRMTAEDVYGWLDSFLQLKKAVRRVEGLRRSERTARLGWLMLCEKEFLHQWRHLLPSGVNE